MSDTRKDVWLAERRTMLTGTDAAQVLAMDADPELAAELGHFGGAMAVYLDKIGEPLERIETEAMRAGNYLQRPILAMYAEQDPDHHIPIVFEPEWTIRRSPALDFIGASLDAMRTDAPAPVDAKNLRRLNPQYWGEPGTDEIPVYYATQLVMQMHVTGADFADLAVLVSGQDLRVYRLQRDKALEADLLHRLYDFWHLNVCQRVPPPIDGSAAWSAHLTRAFRGADLEVLPATMDQHAAAQQYLSARRRIAELDDTQASAANYLKAAIGEHRGLAGAGWKALWSPVGATTGTDWEAVARQIAADLAGPAFRTVLDAVIAQHPKPTRAAYRRFLLTDTGDPRWISMLPTCTTTPHTQRTPNARTSPCRSPRRPSP